MAVGVGLTNICGGSGSGSSLTVVLSNDTPKLSEEITITVTASGLIPTSYTFFLPRVDGTFDEVTQASNTYDWTVWAYGDFEVSVTATDGSLEAGGSATGTTSGDVDADAIITAQEAAIGGSMDATAKAWVLGTIIRWKGVNTTEMVNAYAMMKAQDAEVLMMFPDTVSTASVAGYSINAIDPSRNNTMVGFVAGDATINGLTGGSGKYTIFNNAPDDFDQNDVGVDAYIRSFALRIVIGASDVAANNSGTGIYIYPVSVDGSVRIKTNSNFLNNATIASSQSQNTEMISNQRNSSIGAELKQNGKTFACNSNPVQYAPSSNVFYGMALNNAGTAQDNFTGSVSMLCNRAYLDECALNTFYEAVIWLQTQIGRNV